MLPEPLIGGLNHLLAQNDWACTRLMPFEHRIIRVEAGIFALSLAITPEGYFQKAEDKLPDVTIQLPADAPLRVLAGLSDRNSLLADAKINGSAELADCLGFLCRHLEWNAEDDLAPIVGDIAARRLVQGGQRLAAWQRRKFLNLARNLTEYFTEENPLIASHLAIARFGSEIAALGEELARLEQRVSAMERVERP